MINEWKREVKCLTNIKSNEKIKHPNIVYLNSVRKVSCSKREITSYIVQNKSFALWVTPANDKVYISPGIFLLWISFQWNCQSHRFRSWLYSVSVLVLWTTPDYSSVYVYSVDHDDSPLVPGPWSLVLVPFAIPSPWSLVP